MDAAAAVSSSSSLPSSSTMYALTDSSNTTSSAATTDTDPATHTPMRALPDHEQNTEFELKLGKAMDTLRQDYPHLLTQLPSLQIYDPNLEVVDPSGVTLHSLKSYKTSFGLIHMVIKLFYCPDQSSLKYKLVYDCARKNIRIRWNAILIPRAIYGGEKNPLHVDGISVYELDRQSGLIVQHRVEHLLVNDAKVNAPQGIFAVIQDQANNGRENEIPVFYKNHDIDNGEYDYEYDSNTSQHNRDVCPNLGVLEFKNLPFISKISSSTSLSLFSEDSSDNNNNNNPMFNEEAYQAKNASRRKFGLPPISESEYVQIEAETQKLQQTQKLKGEAASAAAAQARLAKEKKDNNIFSRFVGSLRQDTCQSNFDCERPEVCCDFGFKKMCCKSGMGVSNMMPGQKSLEKIPVRVVADDGDWADRGGGPGGAGMNDSW